MKYMDNNLSIAELVPAKEQLELIVSESKKTDITNLDQTHTMRIKLRDARISITRTGKSLRENALKFQKDVIAKEKELIEIITPEEERLEKAEDEMKLKAEMEKRRDELPSRLEALASIGDELPIDESEILTLDDNQFNEYRLARIDAKLKKDRDDHDAKIRADEEAARLQREKEDAERRAKLEAEEAKLAAERAAIEAEKIRIAAEEKARKDAEEEKERELQRKEREAQLEKERIEREAQAEKDRLAKEAEDKARKEKEMQESAKFKEYLASIGYDDATDMIETTATGRMIIWRRIGDYKKE
jgi:hypothetical protein